MFGLGYLNEAEGSPNSAHELKWQYNSCALVCMGYPVHSNFYQAGCWNSSAGEKSLRHVTSFKAHSCLITMALDHFHTFCWPIERSAGAHALPCTLLQHPPPAPQQPLASPAAAAVTQNEWSRLRNVDTKGGMSFCWVQPHPPYPFHTHTHKYTQQCPTSPGMFKHRGVKSLIMTSFMIKAVVYMTERNTWSNFIGHIWDFVRKKKCLYFWIVWFRTTCMTVAGEWKTWRWLWCGWSWWFERLEVGCFFSFHWFNSLPYLWEKMNTNNVPPLRQAETSYKGGKDHRQRGAWARIKQTAAQNSQIIRLLQKYIYKKKNMREWDKWYS